jgi:hypothetical protein
MAYLKLTNIFFNRWLDHKDKRLNIRFFDSERKQTYSICITYTVTFLLSVYLYPNLSLASWQGTPLGPAICYPSKLAAQVSF